MERLDAFMARSNAAFYAGPDPLAHFTTAPEISQAFGECLGLWGAVTWQQHGSPSPVWLVELGPGRGTLMADAWRAIAQMVPGFAAAARIALVESSPSLRRRQQAALAGLPATWFASLEDVPAGPAIVLANEFLDALPIRQFVRRGTGWMERWVRDGGFIELPAAPPLPDAPEGTVAETAEPARALVAGLAARLARQGGAALIIDYGPASGGFGDTLQALRHHAAADPLAAPGAADLTAHVDFAGIAGAASTASVHGPLPMGLFLQRLGLLSRAAMLAQAATVAASAVGTAASAGTRSRPASREPGPAGAQPGATGSQPGAAKGQPGPAGGHPGAARAQPGAAGSQPRPASSQPNAAGSQPGLILSGAQRLVAAEGMGSLFKALCLGQPGHPVPAGFE